MAKITQIIPYPSPGYDTGATMASKMNEALETVERDSSLEGDGNSSTPLKIVDLESIYFRDDLTGGVVLRGFDFKVSSKTEYGGTSTITTSSDVAYTLGNTVNAGDFLKVSNDTLGARVILKVERV